MKELVTIQSTLKAPKNQYNSFGKYKYRSAESILEAVKPLLYQTNTTLTISDEVVEVGGRIYIKATATLTNDKRESVSTTAFAREEENIKGMSQSQVSGSCSSYARKYALNGLFAIDDTKDADALNTSADYTSNDDEVNVAIASLASAMTRDDLKKIWDNCKALQKNDKFLAAVKKRGEEVK